MKREINTVDLFCGAGGASTGLELALQSLGMTHKGIAINHWSVAVETMRLNHPDVDTKQMSIEAAVPADMVPGGVVDLIWASPSCTHHSRARGGRPRANQLRAQPELIFTWIDQLYVRRLIVENVPEFVEWGPLNRDGTPNKLRRGANFRAWVESIRARGYIVEWRIVTCADYGDATTRKRFFLKAVKIGCGKIAWPEPTHAEHPAPDLFRAQLKPWRGVRECIDFSDTGTSIFARKKPLAENTLRRIEVGLRRFCGIEIKPFLVKLRNNDTVEDIDRPIDTITAGGQHHALCTPFIVKSNHNQDAEDIDRPLSTVVSHTCHHALCQPFVVEFTRNGKARGVERPLGTVTTKEHQGGVSAFVLDHFKNGKPASADAPIGAQTTHDRFSVVQPLILGQQGGAECHPVSEPCPTIATKGAIRVITPFVVDNANGGVLVESGRPVNTITAKDNHMGVFPVLKDGRVIDVRMRMLKPKELAAAHSFPPDYVLTGTITEQVKQVGNSVPVMTAAAMCKVDFMKCTATR